MTQAPIGGLREHGVLLTVAYDGTAFSGWATQKDTRTVEEALRGAILALDPRATSPRGCSRTDAGVHAEGQLAAFDASLGMPPRGWVLQLNQNLPDDVCVRAARAVTVSYNPRFTSRKKRYRYLLVRDKVPDPLLRNRAWRVGFDMDMDKMVREARAIVGTHDFAAFRSARDVREVTVRNITSVEVAPLVVRPAPLVDHHRGQLVPLQHGAHPRRHARRRRPRRAARRHDRERARRRPSARVAGQTAPAHGLTLQHIDVALPEEAGAPWPP